MKNELFIKNVKILAIIALKKNMNYTHRILSICHAVFESNIKNNRITPGDAFYIIRTHKASIINHPLNFMALNFFHFSALIQLFDLDEMITESQSEDILKSMHEYLLIQKIDDKNLNGFDEEKDLNKLSCREITDKVYTLTDQCGGCYQLENFLYTSLTIFINFVDSSDEVNEKHLNMLLNENKETILNYLQETDNNPFSPEISLVLYHSFINSNVFDFLLSILKTNTFKVKT